MSYNSHGHYTAISAEETDGILTPDDLAESPIFEFDRETSVTLRLYGSLMGIDRDALSLPLSLAGRNLPGQAALFCNHHKMAVALRRWARFLMK